MRKFINNQDVIDCFHTEDVQSFVKDVARELNIADGEKRIKLSEYKRGKDGYVFENSYASFDPNSGNIMQSCFIQGLLRGCSQFFIVNFLPDKKS